MKKKKFSHKVKLESGKAIFTNDFQEAKRVSYFLDDPIGSHTWWCPNCEHKNNGPRPFDLNVAYKMACVSCFENVDSPSIESPAPDGKLLQASNTASMDHVHVSWATREIYDGKPQTTEVIVCVTNLRAIGGLYPNEVIHLGSAGRLSPIQHGWRWELDLILGFLSITEDDVDEDFFHGYSDKFKKFVNNFETNSTVSYWRDQLVPRES